MKFWDASALVPLAISEQRSAEVRSLMNTDQDLIIWALTPVEIASALMRRWHLDHDDVSRDVSEAQVSILAARWKMVERVDAAAERAITMLRRHPLRAADALQLAAALIAAEERPLLPFVTLDSRLAAAARAEGFSVLPG